MTAAVMIAVLAIAGLVYVVAPVGRHRKTLVEVASESDAEEQKRVALTGILDVEEERDAGKLSEPEFEELRTRYEREAVAAIQALEEEAPEATADRLEQEIAAAREKLRCRMCGAPRGSATRCPSCGSS